LKHPLKKTHQTGYGPIGDGNIKERIATRECMV
jgi:hypothetical protein